MDVILNIPLPKPNALTAPYWQGAASGELRLQYCASCAHHIHPPLPSCPSCHGELLWKASSGRGTVYSFTDAVHPVHPALVGKVPYRILLVDLDESVRLIAGAQGHCLTDAKIIGRRVSVQFVSVTPDITLPMFGYTNGTEDD